MWPDVQEQVEVEREQIDRLFRAYRPTLSKTKRGEPDFIELAALGAMLHSFYTGLENIFKRIAAGIDDDIPRGTNSHSALLVQMGRSTNIRPAVISEALRLRLSGYMSFRHVFRHAYSFQLEWRKMRDLAHQSEETWALVRDELDQFFANEV